MAVKIGHASIDERGRASGGSAGDQTNREVYIKDYYICRDSWGVVLRPVSSEIAEKSAKACEAGCANNNIGYDQMQRNTLHTEAKKVGYDLSKVKVKCETDCSAYMTVCAIAGGVKELEYTGNAPTTSTMVKKFTDTGKYKPLREFKYLKSSDYLLRGDILVLPGHHTAMVLSNGAKANAKAKSKTKTKKEKPVIEFYPKYKGKKTSIIAAMNEMGLDSSFNNRKVIAHNNSIFDYHGTATQNLKLLTLLKNGKLIKKN